MIYFSLVHAAYHSCHWLPRPTHLRLQVTILFSGLAILLLDFWVLLRPRSSHYCSQPLLYNLVVNIIFAFFTTGLALLLTRVEPGPKAVAGLFAVFGVASFAEGVCTMVFTALASNCEKTTPELYYLSLLLSAGSLVSTEAMESWNSYGDLGTMETLEPVFQAAYVAIQSSRETLKRQE